MLHTFYIPPHTRGGSSFLVYENKIIIYWLGSESCDRRTATCFFFTSMWSPSTTGLPKRTSAKWLAKRKDWFGVVWNDLTTGKKESTPFNLRRRRMWRERWCRYLYQVWNIGTNFQWTASVWLVGIKDWVVSFILVLCEIGVLQFLYSGSLSVDLGTKGRKTKAYKYFAWCVIIPSKENRFTILCPFFPPLGSFVFRPSVLSKFCLSTFYNKFTSVLQ